MTVIKGKQAVLSLRIDGTFYPVLCAIAVSYQFDVEEVRRVTRTSGRYVSRKGRMIEWGISLTGLTKINNTDGQVGWFWLLQNAGTEQNIRLRFTDDAGTIVNVYGNVFIKNGAIDNQVAGLSNVTLQLPGSGAPSTDADPGVMTPTLFTLYLQATEDAFEVSHADLGGADKINLVLREDGGYTEVTGTPTGRQFKFIDNTSSGTIRFDSNIPFGPGEIITVQYQKII